MNQSDTPKGVLSMNQHEDHPIHIMAWKSRNSNSNFIIWLGTPTPRRRGSRMDLS